MGKYVKKNHKVNGIYRPPVYVRTAQEVVGSANPDRARGGVYIAFDRPVHAPETADGTTARAVAAPLALGAAVHGGLTLTLTPDFQSWLAGGDS